MLHREQVIKTRLQPKQSGFRALIFNHLYWSITNVITQSYYDAHWS